MFDKIYIDNIIEEVEATQKMAGLEVSSEVKELIRKCLLGEVFFEEAKEKIINKIVSEL